MDLICICGHRRGQHGSGRGATVEGKCCASTCSCARFQVPPEDEARARLVFAVEETLNATTGGSVTTYTHVLIAYLAPLAEVIVQEAVRRIQESPR